MRPGVLFCGGCLSHCGNKQARSAYVRQAAPFLCRVSIPRIRGLFFFSLSEEINARVGLEIFWKTCYT